MSKWISAHTWKNASKESRAMPYIPYWFESFACCVPWIVPVVAIIGLWIANLSLDKRLKHFAQRTYFAIMLLVAWCTLRTVLDNEGCWILHTGSMGLMVIGAIFPTSDSEADGLLAEWN
jgi:hypothetical protein